jgi:citrate lyase subunit beta/citryl-CoA lyase
MASRDAENQRRRCEMRSLLFVPADSPRKLEKSLQSGSDVLIFDLEDAVSPSRKHEGREELVKFLTEVKRAGLKTPELYVRVNALTTGMTLADLAAVMPCRPSGVVLPKATGARDLALLSAYLEAFEYLYPKASAVGADASTPVQTSIIAIVTETADALAGLNEYRGATPRLAGMMWGAEDLSGDIGALTNKEEGTSEWTTPFKLVRSLCLFAASAAGVPAIDTVPTEINNVEALTRETRQAYRDGFSAKAAIHPGQVPVINAAMTPDAATQEWASRVIAAFAASASVGVATMDGKMLDTPHLRLAKKIIAAAQLA